MNRMCKAQHRESIDRVYLHIATDCHVESIDTHHEIHESHQVFRERYQFSTVVTAHSTRTHMAGFIGIETSPDGKYVAIIERRGGNGDYISIYHANSYILLQRFALDLVDVENIKWSPNSMYLIAWDNCLYVSIST